MQGSPDECVTEEHLRSLFQVDPVMIRHPQHELPQFLLKKKTRLYIRAASLQGQHFNKKGF